MTRNPGDAPAASARREDDSERRIGAVRGDRPGPLFLCISSLHGNEPAGIAAVECVLARLDEREVAIRGDFVGLRGNLSALASGERFVDEDMNRVWQHDRVAAVLKSLRAEGDAGHTGGDVDETLPMVGNVELREQRDLLAAIRDEVRRARGPVIVVDLHTTSSESAPFTTLGDTLQNRALALELPIPVVLGLEEQIDGAMLQYFDLLGWRSIGIEGGSHTAESSAIAHEDALWLLLSATGVLPEAVSPALADRWERLAARARGLPSVVDVRYRHVISEDSGFRMRPGYENFDRIRKGEELGTDRDGVVRAPSSGRIFMPLYQALGDDGFFIVRRLNPVWLRVSRILRSAGFDRFAAWLPGVQVHPGRDDALILSPVARNRVVMGLLHLLGFNARNERDHVLMIRRAEAPDPQSELDLSV
ncbi:MAG: succinylglutamate desuccinylase/aspartoacylase family protein [Gemmatimonadetes bacterium]|nr:succinylglutamate desuccinylase/aspartoacylase family protein [Gemmatimonadota bacterium]